MINKEKMSDLLQWMYETVRDFAGSSTYDIPYEWIKDGYQIDVSNHDVQAEIMDLWCDNRAMDLIQAIDFDDLHQKVFVMIWESNGKKKYTIDEYEEFCSNALQAPPIEDFEDGKLDEEKWLKDHMIHITVGNHDIELGYYADNVNEIEYALKEMYEAEHGGEPTTGNTVGGGYPNATWKDVLKVAVLMIFERNDYNYKGAIKTIHKFFDDEHFREALMFAEKEYDTLNDHFNVNFLKIDSRELHKLFDEKARYEALQSILCSNLQIEELYDQEGRCADKVVLTDYSIRPTGDLVGWHYGVDWDKDSEDNQYYIQEYIKEMLK